MIEFRLSYEPEKLIGSMKGDITLSKTMNFMTREGSRIEIPVAEMRVNQKLDRFVRVDGIPHEVLNSILGFNQNRNF